MTHDKDTKCEHGNVFDDCYYPACHAVGRCSCHSEADFKVKHHSQNQPQEDISGDIVKGLDKLYAPQEPNENSRADDRLFGDPSPAWEVRIDEFVRDVTAVGQRPKSEVHRRLNELLLTKEAEAEARGRQQNRDAFTNKWIEDARQAERRTLGEKLSIILNNWAAGAIVIIIAIALVFGHKQQVVRVGVKTPMYYSMPP